MLSQTHVGSVITFGKVCPQLFNLISGQCYNNHNIWGQNGDKMNNQKCDLYLDFTNLYDQPLCINC